MLKFVDHLHESLKYFNLYCKYFNIVENTYVELQFTKLTKLTNRPQGEMIKKGHILSYDFEHHNANALPEWTNDFTSLPMFIS